MTAIHLQESGPAALVRLTVAEISALTGTGAVTATPTARQGEWMLRAAQKVGVVSVNGLEVWIRPKVPLSRVVWMLGYGKDPGWLDSSSGLGTVPDLLPAIAVAFVRTAERALQRGLLQGYRTVEGAEPVLRGRLVFAEQLRRHHGLHLPLEIRYDEFDVDIAENQILLAAAHRLLNLPGVGPQVRHRLHALRLRLVGITRINPAAQPPRWQPGRLNTRYHAALRLAEIILANAAVEHQPGSVRVDGFLIDMSRVFEQFVCAALREVLLARSGSVRTPDRVHLDVAGRIAIRPDLVWYDHGTPVAVVDAKYKAEKPAGFPDADLYQVLAYCTALRLTHGHLIYAKGEAPASSHTIRNTGITVVQHALDLSVLPRQILDQVQAVAATIITTGIQHRPSDSLSGLAAGAQ